MNDFGRSSFAHLSRWRCLQRRMLSVGRFIFVLILWMVTRLLRTCGCWDGGHRVIQGVAGRALQRTNMPHNPLNLDRLLLVEENREALAAPPRPLRKRKVARPFKRRRRLSARTSIEDRPLPRLPSIMRIRRLIMAALRVWELKHGIHDSPWIDLDQQELL